MFCDYTGLFFIFSERFALSQQAAIEWVCVGRVHCSSPDCGGQVPHPQQYKNFGFFIGTDP
jgi:hypothetical protein